jgi:hypothetical protein
MSTLRIEREEFAGQRRLADSGGVRGKGGGMVPSKVWFMDAKNHPLKGLDTASFQLPPRVTDPVSKNNTLCRMRHGRNRGGHPWRRDPGTGTTTQRSTIRYPRMAAQALFQLAAGPSRTSPPRTTGTELTFWQLRECSDGERPRTLGVKGDRVGLHPPLSQFVIAYLAVLSLGAIVVNLNPLASATEQVHHRNHGPGDPLLRHDACQRRPPVRMRASGR